MHIAGSFGGGPISRLGAIVELIVPGIRNLVAEGQRDGRSAIECAEVEARFAQDDVVLMVQHRLVSRRELDVYARPKLMELIRDRVRLAMGAAIPPLEPPHTMRVERRRLHHRGHLARQSKPKRGKKPCR